MKIDKNNKSMKTCTQRCKLRIKDSCLKFRKSFLPKKRFLYFLGIDVVFFGIIYFAYKFLFIYLMGGLERITQGMTSAEIQQLFSTATENAQILAADLVGFIFLALFLIILFLLFTLFLFSASRKYMWDLVLSKKQKDVQKKFGKLALAKKNFRWAGFVILTIPVILGSSVILLSLKTALIYLIAFIFKTIISQDVLGLINNILTFFVLVIILQWWFSACLNFTLVPKVWASVGEAFALFKKRWLRIINGAICQSLVFIIVNFVVVYSLSKLLAGQFVLSQMAQTLILLLFLAWSRNYFVQNIVNEKEQDKANHIVEESS
jgi:hypothetical protein